MADFATCLGHFHRTKGPIDPITKAPRLGLRCRQACRNNPQSPVFSGHMNKVRIRLICNAAGFFFMKGYPAGDRVFRNAIDECLHIGSTYNEGNATAVIRLNIAGRRPSTPFAS